MSNATPVPPLDHDLGDENDRASDAVTDAEITDQRGRERVLDPDGNDDPIDGGEADRRAAGDRSEQG